MTRKYRVGERVFVSCSSIHPKLPSYHDRRHVLAIEFLERSDRVVPSGRPVALLVTRLAAKRVYFKLGADPSGFPQTRRVCPQLEIHPAKPPSSRMRFLAACGCVGMWSKDRDHATAADPVSARSYNNGQVGQLIPLSERHYQTHDQILDQMERLADPVDAADQKLSDGNS